MKRIIIAVLALLVVAPPAMASTTAAWAPGGVSCYTDRGGYEACVQSMSLAARVTNHTAVRHRYTCVWAAHWAASVPTGDGAGVTTVATRSLTQKASLWVRPGHTARFTSAPSNDPGPNGVTAVLPGATLAPVKDTARCSITA